MAKKAYIGVEGIARKIKKGYIGVDEIARKIKKAYIGIGGVARPCFSSSGLHYYGEITSLGASLYDFAATSVGDYALFGGGAISVSNPRDYVKAYNSSFTQMTPTALSVAREELTATSVGNYALFAGGAKCRLNSGDLTYTEYDTVDAYDISLTRTIPTVLSYAKRRIAATSVGNYALFCGGKSSSYNDQSGNFIFRESDAYNTSLTRSILTSLSDDKGDLAATTIGNYALFGGGSGTETKPNSDTVDAYDTSLTKIMPTALSVGRYSLAATSVGAYALFGGGYIYNSDAPHSSVVDAYNQSLTRSTPIGLSVARSNLSATTAGIYALFSGGNDKSNEAAAYVVDAYDISLTRTIPTALTGDGNGSAATSLKNYALFGARYGKVEVYEYVPE